jgi:uncharacterized phage protein (TIGR01671 family)
MREILFRGKRTDNGEWIYGNFVSGIFFRGEKKEDVPYIMTGDYIDYDCFGDFADECGYYEVDPATVGQYIGETDKNGVKIFEGDRVLTDEAGWIGHVTFGGGEFYVTDEHGGYARCCNWSDYEVLGNIHDAPEGETGGGAWR